MNRPVKLIPVGNSTGVILPKELLARLRLAAGDMLNVSETPGGIELRPFDAGLEEEVAAMRDVMRRRRAALRELAK